MVSLRQGNPLEPSVNLALFLDFDGTIVDIAPTPESISVPENLPSLLVALYEALGEAVAIITGRSIKQIDDLLDCAIPAIAGLHGLERRTTTGHIVRPDLPLDDLQRVRRRLQEFATEHEGVIVEDKKYAVALHYRHAPSLADACRDVMNAALKDNMDGWQAIEGKFIFDMRPRDSSKGAAIKEFMCEAPFRGRMPIFCGDDIADEDGFAVVNALGGLGILVGNRSHTQAAVRVDTVEHLLDWLTKVIGAI